ncbi:hypothetical protein CGRA01v4_13450 [Colletotrichum graminicola]|nr:hypothetical protein CGRA01v4_13450 [Colletotrichum graminicola]
MLGTELHLGAWRDGAIFTSRSESVGPRKSF